MQVPGTPQDSQWPISGSSCLSTPSLRLGEISDLGRKPNSRRPTRLVWSCRLDLEDKSLVTSELAYPSTTFRGRLQQQFPSTGQKSYKLMWDPPKGWFLSWPCSCCIWPVLGWPPAVAAGVVWGFRIGWQPVARVSVLDLGSEHAVSTP